LIVVDGLRHDYRGAEGRRVPALVGVSTQFHPGEFTVVLGRNGSGKSTLARHLNGLLQPTAGRVEVDGLDPCDDRQVWQVRRRVGMVMQNPDNQLVATVVEDDIAFGVENLGLPPERIERRLEEVTEALGIRELRQAEPHMLSSGQKQLVVIAGVLAMRPRYLVLDEPSALLAPRDRALVLGAVERLREETGIGVVLITHHMTEALGADRVMVMSQGSLALEGTPRHVLSSVDDMWRLGLDVPEPTRIAHELRTRHGIEVPADTLTVDELWAALSSRMGAPA
jgi:energy-coupling factor transport system ATP-binding protein